MQPENRQTFELSAFLRRHRRNIGIPLALAALLLARYDPQFLLHSVILVIFGELIRIWAAGHLRKEQILTTGGPYRFIRNPLYLGSFLIAAGFGFVSGSVWVWVLIFGYFLPVYVPVVKYEERILREKFPEYDSYAACVPAFYPSLTQYQSSSTKFSFRQVIRNKEYNAVTGILAVYTFLILVSPR